MPGTLGGATLGAGGATNTQWNPAQQPTAPASSGYTRISQDSGLMGPQGSGIVPVGQQGAANVGGFQTGGYQYNIAPQGNIQSSTLDNSGQFNTNAINAAQMPVSSVQAGQAYMQNMQDAYWNQAQSRLNPQWQTQSDQMAAQLANQGITPGSEAWNRQMSQFNLAKNDAYGQAMNQAILNSGAEAARMQGMDISAGNFANQAAQQNYQNQLTSQQAQNAALTGQQNAALAASNFANQAQQQQWNQAMGQAQLNNAALGQQQGFATKEDVAKKNLAAANAQSAAANAAAGNQMALGLAQIQSQQQLAEMGMSLQARGMQDTERTQDFNMAQQMQAQPYLLQNLAMQGMNIPTDMPNMPSVNQMQAAQLPQGFGQQAAAANNQSSGGIGSMIGSV